MTRWYLSKSSNPKCKPYPNGNLTCRQWLIVSRRVFPGFFIFWGNHYWWFFNGFVKWLDGICLKVLIQNVSHTLTVIWPVVKWLIVSRRVFPGFFIFYIFFIYNVSFLRVSHSTSEPVIWSVISFGYGNIQIYKYTNIQMYKLPSLSSVWYDITDHY